MPYKIMQDVVAKRRAEYPEYDFLSDYQVHSANLVSSTIHGKAQQKSLDVGPVYVPFPTGSGKTVGASAFIYLKKIVAANPRNLRSPFGEA